MQRVPLRALAIALCSASLLSLTGTSWAGKPSVPPSQKQDPWPQKAYWPSDLTGPFEVERTPIEVEAADRVKLRGTLWMPVGLPEGLKVPAILWQSPYFGNLDGTSDDPNENGVKPGEADDGTTPHTLMVRVRKVLLARHGFAVAAVSVRGTGQSGGCMDLFGAVDGTDAHTLIEWLASQPWSNGRVGQIGVSYDGHVAIRGAIDGPPSLKAIASMSAPIDYYTMVNGTPEGAQSPVTVAAQGPSNHAVYDLPTVHRDPQGQIDAVARFFDLTNEESEGEPDPAAAGGSTICREALGTIATNVHDTVLPDRTEAFYRERRLYSDLSRITAASLFTMGLHDPTVENWGLDAVGWELMDAPTSMVFGQWGHCSPAYMTEDWNDRLLRWFDYWLKGLGDISSEIGRVDYELNTDPEIGDCLEGVADDDRWESTSSWPPKQTKNESLFLSGDALTVASTQGPAADLAAEPSLAPLAALCGETDGAVAFKGETLRQESWLTGSPFAALEMTSSEPEGILEARLIELGDGFDCASSPDDFSTLALGAADLRYYRGNFSPIPFDTTQPQKVRISFSNLAERLEAGHRIALVLSGPTVNEVDPSYSNFGTATMPRISILSSGSHESSQLVLPISAGSVGKPATGHYPERADLSS